jgi:hypothetical protein
VAQIGIMNCMPLFKVFCLYDSKNHGKYRNEDSCGHVGSAECRVCCVIATDMLTWINEIGVVCS